MKIFLLIFTFILFFNSESLALDIIYSNNLMGRLEHCGCPGNRIGGMARRKTMIDEIKRTVGDERALIIVDGGNSLFDSKNIDKLNLCTLNLKTDYFVNALMESGIDGINLGSEDLKLETGLLINLIRTYKLPLISTNIAFRETDDVKRYVILERRGVRIGVMGVSYAEDVPDGFSYTSPQEAVREFYPQIRDTDYKILLADMPDEKLNAIIREYHFDFVVDGYSKKERYSEQRTIGGVMVLSARDEGKTLGLFDYNGENRIFPLADDVADDGYVTEIVEMYKLKNKDCRDEGAFSLVNRTFVSALSCLPCHETIYYKWRNTPHSSAYAGLLKERNDNNPVCVGCHTTGYRIEGGFGSSYNIGDMKGVQCEACHGQGLWHVWQGGDKKHIKRRVPEAVCAGCHEKERSPDFDYRGYLNNVSCSINHRIEEDIVFTEKENSLRIGFKLFNAPKIDNDTISIEILENRSSIDFTASVIKVPEILSGLVTDDRIPAVTIPYKRKQASDSTQEKDGFSKRIRAKLHYRYSKDNELRDGSYIFTFFEPEPQIESSPSGLPVVISGPGRLWITTTPSTDVFLNGENQEYGTPRLLTLDPGVYRVELRNDEYEIYYEEEIKIGAGLPPLQKIDLYFTVNLIARSRPFPVDISIDNGSNWRQTLFSMKGLQSGAYNIRIKNEKEGVYSHFKAEIKPYNPKVVIELIINEDKSVLLREVLKDGEFREHAIVDGGTVVLNKH